MGAAVYIVLEHDIEGLDSFVSGKALALASDELTDLAHDIGVRPLMEFFSMEAGEVGAFLEDHQLLTEATPTQKWFKASDGLVTVRGLLNHMRMERTRFPNQLGVIEDLEQFERILREAETRNVRWHLAVDY